VTGKTTGDTTEWAKQLRAQHRLTCVMRGPKFDATMPRPATASAATNTQAVAGLMSPEARFNTQRQHTHKGNACHSIAVVVRSYC
jgi:hypothetical protein